MSEPVRFCTEQTLALVDEHAARFAVMVNAGAVPAEAMARTLTEMVTEIDARLAAQGLGAGGDTAIATLLWGVLLDDLVETSRSS